jgi:hypothetical protein
MSDIESIQITCQQIDEDGEYGFFISVVGLGSAQESVELAEAMADPFSRLLVRALMGDGVKIIHEEGGRLQ